MTKQAANKIIFESIANSLIKEAAPIGQFAQMASKLMRLRHPIQGASEGVKLRTFFGRGKNYVADVAKAYKDKGGKGVVNYMASHRSDTFKNVGKGQMQARTRSSSLNDSTGFWQRSIGDSVNSVRNLTRGVPQAQGANKVTQVGKNFADEIKNQVTSSRYRTVDKSRLNSDGTFGIFRRKARGTAADGKAIIKKTTPMQALGIASTPVGFAGVDAALSPKDKAKAGVSTLGAWTYGKPIAEARLGLDFGKDIYKSITG